MNKDSGINLKMLQVSGGMSRNKLLLQLQADFLGIPVGKLLELDKSSNNIEQKQNKKRFHSLKLFS